jgi:hypothetical protein
MGTRKQREKQEDIWIAQTELPSAPGRPFYQRQHRADCEAESSDIGLPSLESINIGVCALLDVVNGERWAWTVKKIQSTPCSDEHADHASSYGRRCRRQANRLRIETMTFLRKLKRVREPHLLPPWNRACDDSRRRRQTCRNPRFAGTSLLS